MAVCRTTRLEANWHQISVCSVLVVSLPEVLQSMRMIFNEWVLLQFSKTEIPVDVVHYWPYFEHVKITHFRHWLLLHWWNIYLRLARA